MMSVDFASAFQRGDLFCFVPCLRLADFGGRFLPTSALRLRLWFVLPPGSPFGLGPLRMDNATLIAPLITPSSPAPLVRAPKTDWIGVCCLSACPLGIMTGYQKTTARLPTPDRKRGVLLGARFNKPGRSSGAATFIIPI